MATKTKTKSAKKAKSFVVSFRINEATKAAADKHLEAIGLASYTISDAARDAYQSALKSCGLM